MSAEHDAARVLIVEPDQAGRELMTRVVRSTGRGVEAFSSLVRARGILDRGHIDVALIDEAAGTGALLDEVRACRSLCPRVAVIVTGTMLSKRVLIELIRLGVAGVLEKPFTPDELRRVIEEAAFRAQPGHAGAMEYAGAIALAHAAVVEGRTADARLAVARAQAIAPLDGEAMAVAAAIAELSGDLDGADHGYRAALALAHGSEPMTPDPSEGLARLALYRGTEVVAELTRAPTGAVLVDALDAATLEGHPLVLLSLGIDGPVRAAPIVRYDASADRALVITPTRLGEQAARELLGLLGLAQLPVRVHSPGEGRPRPSEDAR